MGGQRGVRRRPRFRHARPRRAIRQGHVRAGYPPLADATVSEYRREVQQRVLFRGRCFLCMIIFRVSQTPKHPARKRTPKSRSQNSHTLSNRGSLIQTVCGLDPNSSQRNPCRRDSRQRISAQIVRNAIAVCGRRRGILRVR